MGQIKRRTAQLGILQPLAISAVLACCVLLTSCGAISNLQQKRATKKKEEALKKLVSQSANEARNRLGENAVGEIHYVDEESGFILMRTLTGQRIVSGTKLIAANADGSGIVKLTASSAGKPPFLAADINSGKPVIGMVVKPDAGAAAPTQPKPLTADDLPPLHQPEPLPDVNPTSPETPLENPTAQPIPGQIMPEDPLPTDLPNPDPAPPPVAPTETPTSPEPAEEPPVVPQN